jgi:hypothetical protein
MKPTPMFAFQVTAARDGVELGKCRVMASYEDDAWYYGWRQMIKDRIFDMFDDTLTIRVESVNAARS